MIAFLCCILDVTEVAGNATAHAEYTGFLVQNVQNLVYGLAFLVADELNNGRVDITTSGSHDQTLKRSQTHAGVYALTTDGSRDACTVS